MSARLPPRGFSRALRAGWDGSLPRWRARALAGVAGGQMVVKVGAGDTVATVCIAEFCLHGRLHGQPDRQRAHR